jgi:hypothetical protein
LSVHEGDEMADKPKKDDAQAQLAKAQRAEDAKRAMSDYELEAVAVRAKTERLRALRLARDAAVPVKPPATPKVKKKKPAGAKRKSSSLADWLDGEKAHGRRN